MPGPHSHCIRGGSSCRALKRATRRVLVLTAVAALVQAATCQQVPIPDSTIYTVSSSVGSNGFDSVAIGLNDLPAFSIIDDVVGAPILVQCTDKACSGTTQQAIGSHTDIQDGNIEIDTTSDGRPILSYTFNASLYVVICGDVECTLPNVVQVAESGDRSALRVDTDNVPAVAFRTSAWDVYFLYCGNPSCTNITVRAIDEPGYQGMYIDMVLDHDDRPLISYSDYENGNIKLASCDDRLCTSFHIQLIYDFDDWALVDISLATSSSNRPIVVVGGAGRVQLLVCRNRRCTSQITHNLYSASVSAFFVCVAVGPGDRALVVYNDLSDNTLQLAMCADSECSTYGTAMLVDQVRVGRFATIGIDSHGNTVIPFRDEETGFLNMAIIDLAALNDTVGASPTTGMPFSTTPSVTADVPPSSPCNTLLVTGVEGLNAAIMTGEFVLLPDVTNQGLPVWVRVGLPVEATVYVYAFYVSSTEAVWLFSPVLGSFQAYGIVAPSASVLTHPGQQGQLLVFDGANFVTNEAHKRQCTREQCTSCPACGCTDFIMYCEGPQPPCSNTTYEQSLTIRRTTALPELNADSLGSSTFRRDLYIDHSSLSAIRTGAFSGVEVQGWIYIFTNTIMTIEAGAFDGLRVSRDMIISHTSGIDRLVDGTFRGAEIGTSLRFEKNDDLKVIEQGAFSGLVVGKFLALSVNLGLQVIETFAFQGVRVGTFLDIGGHDILYDLQPYAFDGARIQGSMFFERNNGLSVLKSNAMSNLRIGNDLNFGENENLVGVEPRAFAGTVVQGHFAFIQNLGLTSLEPASFGGIVVKGHFDFNNNNALEALPDRLFEGSKMSQVLIGSNTALKQISPDTFQGADIKWDLSITSNEELRALHAGTFRGLNLDMLTIEGNPRLEQLEEGVFDALTVAHIVIASNKNLRQLSPGVFKGIQGNPTVTIISNVLQCCDLEWLVRGDVVQLSDESQIGCSWPSAVTGMNIFDPVNGYTDLTHPKAICPCGPAEALKPRHTDGQQGAAPMCVTTCGNGFHRRSFYNASGPVCDVCTMHHDMAINERPDPNCLSCTAGDNPDNMFDASTCQLCGNSTFLMEGQGCVDSCDVDIFGQRIFGYRTIAFNANETVGRECELCASAGCIKCDEATDKCTLCGDNTLLLDGRCVDSCPSLLRSGREARSNNPDDYAFRYEARGGQQDLQTGVWTGRTCVLTVEQQIFSVLFVDHDQDEDRDANDDGHDAIGGITILNGTRTVQTVLGASMSDVGLSDVYATFNVSGGALQRFSAVDFPCGLTVAASTGELLGSPQLAGVYNVSVLAFSTQGDSALVANSVTSIVVEDCDDELSCKGGRCVDHVPFDNEFNCDCSGTGFTGSDCTVPVDPQASNSANDTTVYAASGVAAFVIICALLLVLIVVMRSRRRYRDQMRKIEEVKNRANARFRSGDLSALESLAEQHMATLEVSRDSVMLGEEIGKGEFGVVYQGRMEAASKIGRSKAAGGASLAAIKQLHNDAALDAVESFYFEAKLMCVLTHPNIVSILGVCTTTPPFLVCLEYMENGDLRNYLKKNMQKLIDDKAHEDGQLVGVIHQVASAMQHLFFNNIVHRDLAARNVLVGKSLRVVKLADFGMSKNLDESEYYRKTDNEKVPLKWMAPEAIRDKKYSHASDVWSFGVFCWEVFSYGAMPYAHYSPTELIMHVGTGHHLQRPEYCPKDVFTHIKPMWRMDPQQRPEFPGLEKTFHDLLDQSCAHAPKKAGIEVGAPVKANDGPAAYVELLDPADAISDSDTDSASAQSGQDCRPSVHEGFRRFATAAAASATNGNVSSTFPSPQSLNTYVDIDSTGDITGFKSILPRRLAVDASESIV